MIKEEIVFLLDACEGGGVENFISTLIMSNENRYKFKVISLFRPNIEVAHPRSVKIEFLIDEKKRKFKLNEKVKLSKILSEKLEPNQIVIINHPKMSALCGKINLPKMIFVCHGFSREYYSNIINKIRYKIFLRKVYKNKKVVCVSSGLTEILVRKVKVKEITTIHNPINLSNIIEMARGGERFGFKYFTYIGRLSKEKNVDKIINDFKNSTYLKTHKLIIVGDGPEKSYLNRVVDDHGLQDSIIFTGHISNPFSILKHSDALLLASSREGFGYVIVEALALNTPIISVDCDFGPRDILVGQNSRFLRTFESNIFEDVNLSKFSFTEYDLSSLLPKVVMKKYVDFAKV